MRLKIFFAFAMVLAASAAWAQPGYMGKRLAVYYNNYSMAAFMGPTPEDMPLNFRHAISADYSTSRQRAWGGTIQFYRTKASYSEQEIRHSYYDPAYGYISDSYYPSSKAVANIMGTNIGIYYKHFKRSNIAPQGKYNKLGLTFFRYRARYTEWNFRHEYQVYDNYYYPPTTYTYYPQLGSGNDSFNSLGLTWGMGKQRILWDRVVVDTGFEINYIIGSILNAMEANDNYNYSQPDYIRTGAKARIVRHNLINITIGVGYLAK